MPKRIVGDIDSRGKPRVQTKSVGEDMTVQSDAHLADINKIMGDFAAEGISALDDADLMFRDVSEFTDLRDALDQAREAEVVFMRLPSKVREIFEHDVAVWLDTAHDKEKRDALVAAGFIKAIEPDGEETSGTGSVAAAEEAPEPKVAAPNDGEGGTPPK